MNAITQLKKKACGVIVAKQMAQGEQVDLSVARKETQLPANISNRELIEDEGFKEMTEFHLKKLDGLLSLSYDKAKEKAEEGSFRDHINAIDLITKNKRLLNDKSTENVSISAVLDALE